MKWSYVLFQFYSLAIFTCSRTTLNQITDRIKQPCMRKTYFQATCIMFDEKPKMVDDPNRIGKKIPNYWDASKKVLNDPTKFLESLLTYNKDNISEGVIKRVEPYIQMEEFTPEAVSKVSKACTSICMWVRAMYVYHNVALQVSSIRCIMLGMVLRACEVHRHPVWCTCTLM